MELSLSQIRRLGKKITGIGMRIARIGKTKQGHLTIHFGILKILITTTAEAILTGDLNNLLITADQTWGHRDLQQQDLQADQQVHLEDPALADQEVVDNHEVL